MFLWFHNPSISVCPGVIPSHVHLKEVQRCLSRIQNILVNLGINFWKKVETLLDNLKEKTFVGEDLIEDLNDLKEEFLTSIEAAEQVNFSRAHTTGVLGQFIPDLPRLAI